MDHPTRRLDYDADTSAEHSDIRQLGSTEGATDRLCLRCGYLMTPMILAGLKPPTVIKSTLKDLQTWGTRDFPGSLRNSVEQFA